MNKGGERVKGPKDWRRRNRKPLTPETLMHILNQTEGGEKAKEAYKRLTGEEPPEEGEVNER